jgi:menaquinone-specific isochorismate synthase
MTPDGRLAAGRLATGQLVATEASPAGLVSTTSPLPDVPDLLGALDDSGFLWLHEATGLVAAGVAARINVGTGPGRLADAAAAVSRLLADITVDDPLRQPGTGPLAVGALPFADGTPGELVVPAVVVGRTASGRAWTTVTRTADAVPADRGRLGTAHRQAGRAPLPERLAVDSGSRDAWTAAVRGALARITRGEVRKVVLAREVLAEADRPFERAAVLDRLRRVQPSSLTYAVGDFVGASPELLVRRRGARVVSRPMAGTVPRGTTPADDQRLTAALTASPKDGEEHAVVVDAVRRALAPVCRELVSDARPSVTRLATVSHLATTVAGRLRLPAPSALALAGLLHPTPAVAGDPQAEALAAIEELEDIDRGLYAGPVGWVDARGDGDWAVALRCAHLQGNRARLAAGAGIVADSDPGAEWAETEAKLDGMLRALTAG